MKRLDRKIELIKKRQRELDRRTQIENEAIRLIGENRIEKAQELLDSIDDSIVKEIDRELDQLETEQGRSEKLDKEKGHKESNELEFERTISIKRKDVEKLLVAIQQIIKPFELNKRQRAIVDYDPESPSVKINCFTVNE